MSAFVYLESHTIPRGWRPENLREGRPLPYGDIILFACRGGVPPPVKQILIAIFYRADSRGRLSLQERGERSFNR